MNKHFNPFRQFSSINESELLQLAYKYEQINSNKIDQALLRMHFLSRVLGRPLTDYEFDAAKISFSKLSEDLKQSALTTSYNLRDHIAKSRRDLAIIDSCHTQDLEFVYEEVSIFAWRGEIDLESLKILNRIRDTLGRPIVVSCSSINVAACAVLLCLAEIVDLKIDLNSASGREQVLSLKNSPHADVVIAADAPMYFEKDKSVQSFRRVCDLNSENQLMFECVDKNRTARNNGIKYLWCYKSSSAEHQIIRERERAAARGEKIKEEWFYDMADFPVILKQMRRGDLVIAWGTLTDFFLSSRKVMKVVNGSHFRVSKSLYINPEFEKLDKKLAIAFLNTFIAQWQVCNQNKLKSWGVLFSNETLLKNLLIGGALNFEYTDLWPTEGGRGLDAGRSMARNTPTEIAEKIFVENIFMGDSYYNHGQVGAMGRNAKASNNTFQQLTGNPNINIETLKLELESLRAQLKTESKTSENDISIGEIAAAQEALDSGNESKAMQHLKNAGKWTLDVATKIGANVAAAAIKDSIGI